MVNTHGRQSSENKKNATKLLDHISSKYKYLDLCMLGVWEPDEVKPVIFSTMGVPNSEFKCGTEPNAVDFFFFELGWPVLHIFPSK